MQVLREREAVLVADYVADWGKIPVQPSRGLAERRSPTPPSRDGDGRSLRGPVSDPTLATFRPPGVDVTGQCGQVPGVGPSRDDL